MKERTLPARPQRLVSTPGVEPRPGLNREILQEG
ncbi:hypothetical protein MXAN_7470 [Myxococcus xanthus DK 1622]|uniref:Uncharacterized protein n=1 Tax=Myxococcus xanthus (strain DK1622) TaxID=246197 RepID=Q1CVJ9_MYXXD|nr:hypothetical protein MXAN_7470 [Myxococcus xanthus DK 1622]